MNVKRQLNRFRWISLAEGVSFLLLLFIAMPLKYFFESPLMVKYLGWLHGLLFVIYIFQLFYLTILMKWKFRRLFFYFLAAFFPFAPFFVERQVRHLIEKL